MIQSCANVDDSRDVKNSLTHSNINLKHYVVVHVSIYIKCNIQHLDNAFNRHKVMIQFMYKC